MDDQLKEEIWNHFEHTQNIFLATIDGNKPRVRPVTMIFHRDKFWVTTGANNEKIKQIKKNNNIEFCLLLEGDEYKGYIRGSGTANIIKDQKIKKMIADNTPFFKVFWESADDPGYALLEIFIKEIEYLRPQERYAQRFSL